VIVVQLLFVSAVSDPLRKYFGGRSRFEGLVVSRHVQRPVKKLKRRSKIYNSVQFLFVWNGSFVQR
jgi:hypothetical protein